MDREELVDELSDAIDDRMDMDVSYSMLADACVERLEALGLYPMPKGRFHAVDLWACGFLSALATWGATYLLMTGG
jgi:hypothetical protein